MLLVPLSALASGLSVSPARLDFSLIDDNQAQKTITVANPTADVMVFEAYPDEFADIISAYPESFTLEAGGRKEVWINIDASKIKESVNLSTNLSVISKPLAENKVNVGAGAKIPVTISTNPPIKQQNLNTQYYGLVILGGLIILLLLRFNKKLP